LNEHRFIGYGISSYLDLAGESSFGTKNLKVHTSFIQVFGDTKEAHHRISIGISAGIARNKYLAWISDLHNSMQIINTEDYLDLGTGLAWIYKSNTKFTCQIGVSADHLNRPTVSEILGTSNQLERKYTIHGSSEIPLIKRFTVLPGFLFSSQGMIDRGAIGLDSKWYFNPGNAYHSFRSLQMGVYLMEEVDDLDQLKSESIVLRSSIETRSLILGFAYNQVVSGLRNSNFANSAIECTVAYTFGKKEIGEKSIIKDK